MTVIDTLTENGAALERLDPGVFTIPVNDIRIGYRSAVYFNRTQQIMLAEKPDAIVTMQVFQKHSSVLCGIDEVIAILKTCAGHYTDRTSAETLFNLLVSQRQNARVARSAGYKPATLVNVFSVYEESLREMAKTEGAMERLWESGWDKLQVQAAFDGQVMKPWEPVLRITGPYSEFAHLESVYLGILARQTKIATNTAKVTDAAGSKPVLFFADRFDHYATQGGDGYAAKVGGARGFATDSMASWWGDKGTGTMPHALIAAYAGDVCESSAAFHKHYPNADLIALVDFNNDCVGDAVKCVKRFGQDLWGVRLDTSESMVDRSIDEEDMGEVPMTGVNPTLVHKVRSALDTNGGKHVKIVVSGGFTDTKIRAFERADVPVDVYAVGSSLLKGTNDFTADIVYPTAKKGRWQRNYSHLRNVE